MMTNLFLRIGMINNTDTLKLSKDVYSSKAIYETIKAFQKIATIECTESEQYYICKFFRCHYETSLTMNEFGNYLIDLMNTKGFA